MFRLHIVKLEASDERSFWAASVINFDRRQYIEVKFGFPNKYKYIPSGQFPDTYVFLLSILNISLLKLNVSEHMTFYSRLKYKNKTLINQMEDKDEDLSANTLEPDENEWKRLMNG